MKFTQIAPVRFKTQVPGSFREGFILFALGEDGQVYKSIPQPGSSDHKGWVCLAETILPGVSYPPRRESRRYLDKGEKVRVYDSRFGDSSPMAGVIVGVLFDGLGGFSGYEVAWPADAPGERQVFAERQVEKYRELPPAVAGGPAPSIVEQAVAAMAPSQDRQHEMPALVKCGKCGQGRSRGHFSKALYCYTVGNSTFTAVPDEPCPQGCPHPLSEHSSAGCMVKIDPPIEGQTFCPCSWKVAENGEDEAVTKSATVGDINPAELLPDLPGKQALVELCDSTVQAEEQSAILKPEDYPF